MSFSDWQVRLIKNRIVAFREKEGLNAGLKNGLPWKTVSARIEWPKHASASSCEERLRQFAMGVPNKNNGQRQYPVPEPDRLEAICSFLCSEKVGMLDKSELEGAPSALPNFLIGMAEIYAQGGDVSISRNLEGEYRRCYRQQKRLFNHSFSFIPSHIKGVFEVRASIEIFTAAGISDDVRLWPASIRKRSFRSRNNMRGWLIVTGTGRCFGVLSEREQQDKFFDLLGLYLETDVKTASLSFARTKSISRLVDNTIRVNPNFDTYVQDLPKSEQDTIGRALQVVVAKSGAVK